MFEPFFYLLRSRGLNVSLNEWMAFVEAMDKGLPAASLTRFYYMSRALLVKTETDYDKFDRVFLEFFRDAAFESDELSRELLRWLDSPDHEKLGDRGRGELVLGLSGDTIRKMLRERLAEQKEEHNGGAYWVGTDGASPFGNDGESLKGIRVGGSSRRRLALEVAGERRFRDFRDDTVMDSRSFQMAFRQLRQFSSRVDAPRTELNLGETVKRTCDNAGRLRLVFDKPRRNIVKLMLLMDSGGSMDMYAALCASLFQAVSKSNHFKDLKAYYFHNCFTDRLYTTPRVLYRESVGVDWVLRNLDAEYKVVIVGDALMSTWELVERRYYGGEGEASGLERLRLFRDRYPRLVWLNPTEEEPWPDGMWGKSYHLIKKEVPMYALTVENLAGVMKKLMAAR